MASPPPAILEAIRGRLGDAMEACAFRAADREWVGYRAPARAALEDVLRMVAADDALRSAGVRHFVGEGGATVFAIPELPALDVIEAIGIGTHNGSRSDWQSVSELVAQTIAVAGFDVVFADEAGLDARIARAVSPADAIAWDRALLDRMEAEPRWVDSYGFMLDRASDLEPLDGADERGGGLVPAFIVATRSLRLWWD